MNTCLRERQGRARQNAQEIADFANISLKSYQRIEKGAQGPPFQSAKLIAKALGSTVEELF